MKINEVLDELKKVKHTYRDLIITSNYRQINNAEIAWDNYIPGIYKNLYAKEYEILLQNRQYSFLLKEKMGFVQFYFKYLDNNNFEKIKMSYYPFPIKLREESYDIDSYLNDTSDPILEEYYFDLWNILNREFSITVADETSQKIISLFKEELGLELNIDDLVEQKFNHKYEITNSSHIRIDFDSQVTSHHNCEIQVGAVNDIRLPLDRVISPFLFFDFIIKNLHKHSHSSISTKSSFSTDFTMSKRKSHRLQGFNESNIFITHLDS